MSGGPHVAVDDPDPRRCRGRGTWTRVASGMDIRRGSARTLRTGASAAIAVQEVGRDEPAERPALLDDGAANVDPDEGALLHRDVGRAGQRRDQVAEVRVVPDQDGSLRGAGISEDLVDRQWLERAAEPLVDPDRDPQPV